MLFIWRGYGFLVPIIAMAVIALSSFIFNTLLKTAPLVGMSIGALAAATAIWFVGKKFNDPAKNRVMVDKATGQEYIISQNHSLFFIKMQY
jgi:carbamoylphosphate synthase small subunit